MSTQEISVAEIREGDVFTHQGVEVWRATSDAQGDARGAIQVRVQFLADGGRDLRIWDDAAHRLSVERP